MSKYRVYTIRLARYLTEKGYRIIGTTQDLKNPDFINWFFEDTPELLQAVEEYLHK